MLELLAAVGAASRMWYALPLIVSVSLVYGATRHERIGPIISNALRSMVWIAGFMGIIFAVLLVLSWAA